MPAMRFFALVEEGRKQARIEKEIANVIACDIQSISLGNAEYFEKLRNTFYSRILGAEGKSNALDPTDPLTVALIENLTLEASRVNG